MNLLLTGGLPASIKNFQAVGRLKDTRKPMNSSSKLKGLPNEVLPSLTKKMQYVKQKNILDILH